MSPGFYLTLVGLLILCLALVVCATGLGRVGAEERKPTAKKKKKEMCKLIGSAIISVLFYPVEPTVRVQCPRSRGT